ncbi:MULTISPECIES: Tim44 domain-containing protein [Pseudomonas]|uniref:TIM44-like domain-containing protein n=1 Tax=Pseudomonas phytophila TaxID=2867264 RepID=A0ABY6FEC6_9PSED|nr:MULTISPECIES: TIM44-like domain-containing protein [Pseudomonas]MCQ2995645.1 TIM44-like domain-containing protein [Pseudomonas syringae]MCD5972249.1 TIM44-like domain-containing protein [Pseudomonas quasicaspiana]MCD5975911.1 TIM44-like domain-containing protein [Pseudomonas quasicaspiana]MCD5986830.1 TIM44-like domain-containing protein [Pseudomonas quasicaspiana]MCQ2999221.1 TIM44-like domain-containing protein [Pseudomonas syringae]
MQRFLSIAMALCIGLTMSFEANAARFGGGKSMGSAPSHQSRQATPTTPAAAPTAAGRPAASGASRWLGPLAGIAAGGLLASMFMGDGFQGMQIFDILIMAVIAFLIFRFIAARRRKQQGEQMATAAGPMTYQRENAQQPAQNSIFGGSGAASAAAPVINAPAWFNETRFLEAARSHFQSLQQHWDANEMDKIEEFVTPQMLQFLKKERADLGDAFQSTYIDNLNVQLDGLDDRADKTIATLTFSGVSKSSRFDQGEVFSESWNMERPQGDNQPWLVAGIRQNG